MYCVDGHHANLAQALLFETQFPLALILPFMKVFIFSDFAFLLFSCSITAK